MAARRTSGEKEGTWQEKVPSSAEEGRGGGLHFICIPTHTSLRLCQWCELVFHSHCTSTPWTIGIPHLTQPVPPPFPFIHQGRGQSFWNFICIHLTPHFHTLSMCATYTAPLYSMGTTGTPPPICSWWSSTGAVGPNEPLWDLSGTGSR